MIPALQLLQILIINQPLLPQMLKEAEIRPRRAKPLAERKVLVSEMIHLELPRGGAVVARRRPVAQRAAHGARGVFAVEVRGAVRGPLVAVARQVAAVEEPEDAAEEGRLRGEVRGDEDAVDFFQDGVAGELAVVD